jgi:PAS domain S-box-containing protein
MVEMLGYDSASELLGVGTSKSFYADPAVRDRLVEEYLKTGRAEGTVEWKHKSGKTILVRINCRQAWNPSQDDDCIEITAEDVTERRALEKQLLQAQKFEAIGQLAGGIAHDFNNMIGAVLGWADLGWKRRKKARACTGTSRRCGSRPTAPRLSHGNCWPSRAARSLNRGILT